MQALIAGAASFAVYLRTMCRTIYVGDSGELAAAVHVVGIPHPPGYPLYVLLGKLFSLLLPFGKPALRLNLFSAVCCSASVMFVYLTFHLLEFDWFIAAAASLCWAFSASFWSQSGIARVYALGALISAISTWCFVHWYVDLTAMGWLLSAAFVVGLGLANHPVVGAHAFGFTLAAIAVRPEMRTDWLFWATYFACLVPGLLLYVTWIPIRARTKPRVNWGTIQTVADLRRFLGRKEYWRHRWVKSPADAMKVIGFYLSRIISEFHLLGSAAIVAGIGVLATQRLPLAMMTVCVIALNTSSMIAHARREDIFHWTRYMITSWHALVLPLGFGLAFFTTAFPAKARPIVALAAPGILLIAQFRKQDLSRHHYADAYSRQILETLPENAILIAQDDNVVFPLMYLKYAENLRPDVKLLEQGVHQLGELRFNPRKDAVYCTHWQSAFNQPASPRGPGLRLVNEGLIYRIVSTDMQYAPRNLWDKHHLPDMEDPKIPRNYLTRCLLGHVYFMRAEWELPRDAVSAMSWYDRSARMAHDSAVQQYNLALAFERQGWKLLAQDAFVRAAMIDRNYAKENRATPAPSNAAPNSQSPIS